MKVPGAVSFKYIFRVSVALLTFFVGTEAFLVWDRLAVSHLELSPEPETELVPPVNLDGEIILRFMECAGKLSVFILDNETAHPIYARVQRVDYWREFKNSKLEYGLHFIEYKARGGESVDISPRWDAIEPFKMIPPYSIVRYGVDLPKVGGEYIVRVPFMENPEVARRLDEDFASIIKQDLGLVRASWKRVSSGIVTNECR